MKSLIFIFFLFLSTISYSQQATDSIRSHKQKNGYGSITLQGGLKSGYNSTGLALNFGIKPSPRIGLGLGFELISFNNVKTKYVPAYLDCRLFFPNDKRVEFFGIVQPGYGFYSYRDEFESVVQGDTITNSISQKGGFYFSSGVGLKIKGSLSPIFTVRYAINQFNSKLSGKYFEPIGLKSINSIVFNLGLSF